MQRRVCMCVSERNICTCVAVLHVNGHHTGHVPYAIYQHTAVFATSQKVFTRNQLWLCYGLLGTALGEDVAMWSNTRFKEVAIDEKTVKGQYIRPSGQSSKKTTIGRLVEEPHCCSVVLDNVYESSDTTIYELDLFFFPLKFKLCTSLIYLCRLKLDNDIQIPMEMECKQHPKKCSINCQNRYLLILGTTAAHGCRTLLRE